jgi:hypothetical protein
MMDETFRAQLLNNPEGALQSFELSSQEIEAIKNVTADQFQALNESFRTQLGSAQANPEQAFNYLKIGDIPQEVLNANPDAFIPGRLKWAQDGVKYTPKIMYMPDDMKWAPEYDKATPQLLRKRPGRLKWIPGGAATLVGVSIFAVLAIAVGAFAVFAFVGSNIFFNNPDPNNAAALQATAPASQAEVPNQGGVDNVQPGSVVVQVDAAPSAQPDEFTFIGVGYEEGITIPSGGSVMVEDVSPGSYTMTQADPAPDLEVTAISCDDGDSPSPSSGSPSYRTAYIEVDPGETVTCTFVNSAAEINSLEGGSSGDGENGTSGGSTSSEGINPFTDPDTYLPDFPLPTDIPQDAGTYLSPRPGPWVVTNLAGIISCGTFNMDIPASPPENGVLEVLDGGQTVIGSGLDVSQGAPITMTADPDVNGLYFGTFEGIEEGVPVTIYYYWQLVTDIYIVGYLSSEVTAEGMSCSVYRPFELWYLE